MQKFIEAGKAAHANGDMRAPALNATVTEALAGNKVGDPRNLEIMAAFTAGYDMAVELEIKTAELAQIIGKYDAAIMLEHIEEGGSIGGASMYLTMQKYKREDFTAWRRAHGDHMTAACIASIAATADI